MHTRAAAYAKAGHDVRVYRFGHNSLRSYEYEGVNVQDGDREALQADCEQFNAHVVALHTPYPGSPHTRLAERLSLPRVVWVHGYEAMFTALHGYHRGLARILSLPHDARKLWRLRRFLAGSAAVVYVSQWMRRTAERSMRFAHPCTETIPNPVDVQRFRPMAAARRTDGRLRGLALRGLARKYGLDIAIAAYAGLSETELTIVGTGPEARLLRRQIEASHAAVTLEERAVPPAEVPRLMNEFDYFVAPARTEAQGVAMCEAMACGLPVVATRVGGIPEYVREGRDGFLVPPQRPEELRRAVLALARDPQAARSLGREAREHMVDKCSLPKTVGADLHLLARAADLEG